MQRVVLILIAIVGSAIAAGFGVSITLLWDSAILPSLLAAVLPPTLLAVAGVRDAPQLAKICGYAFFGWWFCMLLEPSISASGLRQARLIAEDPLAGYGWYPVCHAASAVFVIVGVAFISANSLNNRPT